MRLHIGRLSLAAESWLCVEEFSMHAQTRLVAIDVNIDGTSQEYRGILYEIDITWIAQR